MRPDEDLRKVRRFADKAGSFANAKKDIVGLLVECSD